MNSLSLKDYFDSERCKSILKGNILEKIEYIFNTVSLDVQIKKTINHNLSKEESSNIINNLKIRPNLLSDIALFFNSKNIAEVGTAEGLQSISFASIIKDSKVYTCDIRDVRNKIFYDLNNIEFILGNSKDMSKQIKNKVDMFWIDGNHEHYSVISDVLNLIKCSTKDTIWVFDDFDNRFGCFYDIQCIINASLESVVIDLGKTASGNPNKIVVCKGLL